MDDKKVSLTFEINEQFFTEIKDILGPNIGNVSYMEHFKNALELYATTIEHMDKGKIPAVLDPSLESAEKIALPNVLVLLKHHKELEYSKKISLKNIL